MADNFEDFEPIQRPNYEDPAAYARDMDFMREEVKRTGPQFDELIAQLGREQSGELGKQPLAELLGESSASYIRVSLEMHDEIDKAIQAKASREGERSSSSDAPRDQARAEVVEATEQESGTEPRKAPEQAPTSGTEAASASSNEKAASGAAAAAPSAESSVGLQESLHSAGLAPEQYGDAFSSGAPGDSTGATGAAGVKASEVAPEKPTDLESLLATTPVSDKRQSRFVMTGDPDIIKAVELKLQARGLMSFVGGQKVISANDRQLNKVMAEVVKGFEGASVNRALELELPREGAGIIGSARAGLDNFFGRRDAVEIVVLGAQSHQDAKMEELGKLVRAMSSKEFFSAQEKDKLSGALSTDNKLVTDGKTPLKLKGSKNLSDLVIMASNVTEPYRRHQREQNETRNELRKSREDQDLVRKAEASVGPKGKEFGALSADGKERLLEAEGLLRGGDKVLYQELPGKGTQAKRALGFAGTVGVKELAEVAPQRAESYLASMTGVLAKELEKPTFKLNAETPGKLQEHLAAMRDRDPESVGRMQKLVDSLVADGALTKQQGDFVSKAIATGELDRSLLSEKGSTNASEKTTEARKEAAVPEASRAPEKSSESSRADAAAGSTAQATDQTAKGSVEKAAVQPQGVEAASGKAAEPPRTEATSPTTQSVSEKDAAAQTQGRVEPTLTSEKVAVRAPVVAPAKGLAADLETVSKAGAEALSPAKAEALLGAVSDLRSSKLSALDSREGEGPSQTLSRLERVLDTVQKGNYPEHLVIQAEELGKSLERWKQEDHKRQGGDAVAADRVAQARDTVTTAEPGWGGAQAPKAAPEAKASPAAPTQEAVPAKDATAAPVADVARKAEAPAQPSLADTQRAVRSLHMDMQWPPKTFITRDKQWNEAAVMKFAEKVANLDAGKVAQLPADDRKSVAAYAAWLADAAGSGKLPGFSSESGKALLQRVTDTGVKLIDNLEPGSTMPEGLAKRLARAEGMTEHMAAREKTMGASAGMAERRADNPGHSSQGAVSSSLQGQDLSRYAKDLAHAVFESRGMSEQHAVRLLKVSAEFTPEALKSLDPQTKARAVTGMEELAKAVRAGDMGAFESLPADVRNSTLKALNTADKLHDALAKDPGMSTELIKARIDLAKEPAQEVQQATSETSRAGGSDAIKATAPRQSEGRVRE